VASIEIVEPEISMRTPVGGGDRLLHRVGEHVAGDGAGGRRHVRQRGVVLDRHRLQAEPGRTAGEAHPRALQHHLDRLGREAATDVGQQPAADQGLALVGDLGGQGGAGGRLVVERRQHQAVVARLDQQTRQHRDAGADGQAACRPGDGIREYVAVDAELHFTGPSQG
jgi:hypothetical protein